MGPKHLRKSPKIPEGLKWIIKRINYPPALSSLTLMRRVVVDAENHSMFDPFDILGLEKSFLLDLRVLDHPITLHNRGPRSSMDLKL